MYLETIQLLVDFCTQPEAAKASLPGIVGLDGCIGARVLRPKWGHHGFAVQAFFPDHPGPLCDGERRVLLRASLVPTLTTKETKGDV